MRMRAWGFDDSFSLEPRLAPTMASPGVAVVAPAVPCLVATAGWASHEDDPVPDPEPAPGPYDPPIDYPGLPSGPVGPGS